MATRRVLIAVDGKKYSEYAFNWYLDNIYKPGDEVVVFHCSSFHLSVNLPGAAVNVEHVSKQVEKAKTEAESVVAAASKILHERGVKFYTVLKHHTKAEEAIMEALEEENITYVVMGTRDYGTIKRTLHGSVSTFVVRHAKVPVTIVKIPGDKHHH